MVKEPINGKMKVNIKGNGLLIKNKAMRFLLPQMELFMFENGLITNSMVKELSLYMARCKHYF